LSIYVPAVKAGPVGPGAGVLNTEFLLPMMLPTDHAHRMSQAVKLGTEVAYIRAAERVISGKFSTVAWHLEDPDGVTIDDEYDQKTDDHNAGDPRAMEAYRLIDAPMAVLDQKEVGTKRTRRQLWEITSRHMGLAGSAPWFLDQLDDFGIPKAILYIRPDRLTPEYASGSRTVLDHWLLDKRPGYAGTRLEIDTVQVFVLETPNEGVFPPGLVESALTKALLNGQIDKHFAQVLQGGGRLAGILAPKQGAIEDDGIYNQMVRDWRNITEQPESARRLQVVRAPVDFIKTAATMAEMQIIDLMSKNRDDLLALWGVPLSQVGGVTAAGLNSGDVRKYDEAALWQNAVHPRLAELAEGVQPILDRFEAYIGWAPQLILDEPEFDDDSPRYDKVQKSQFITLTNDERREQLGYAPLDEDVIGPTGIPLGQEIWTGISMMPVGGHMTAPQVNAKPLQAPAWTPEAAEIPVPGESAQQQGETLTTQVSSPRGGYARKARVSGDQVTTAVLAELRKQWPDSELDIVKEGEWTFVPDFKLSKVNASRRPVPRNPKIVAGVEAALTIGAPIKPITLIRTRVIGKPGYTPIDGWHRALGAEHAGVKRVPAYIGEGDATWTTDLLAFNDEIPTPGKASLSAAQAVKASLPGYQQSLVTLRGNVEARHIPPLRTTVARVLDDQRRDIVSRVRGQYEAIKRKPGDTTLWWPSESRDRQMTGAIRPALGAVVTTVSSNIGGMLGKGTVIERGSMRVDKAAELLRSIADDERQDRSQMVGMVTAFADAVKAQANTPINVTVQPPDIHVPPTVVNVEAPVVNLPPAKPTRKVVKRDADGNITEVREVDA
jgi:Phage portal protein